MNRSDIINWLESYTPAEQNLKAYYEKEHRPAPEDILFQIMQANHGLSNIVNNAFSNIDPSLPINNPPLKDALWHPQFSDQLWMQQNHEMSIRKHPRYLPVLKHTHSFIEIAYIYQGNCKQNFYFDSEHIESVDMKQGYLAIIPPGLKHSIEVFDDSVVINILIRTNAMKYTLTNLVAGNNELFHFFIYTLYENTKANYLMFNTAGNDVITAVLIDMMLELCESKAYSQKVTYLMLGLFFTYLQRDHLDTIRFSKYNTAGIDYIPQVLSYMQEHYRDTSVEDIAHHFFISRSYLSRLFKAYTNSTIIQSLQQIRMQHACDYLINTELSVQNISDAVGYDDVTFFIRTFKKIYQVTPLQYRKQHQE